MRHGTGATCRLAGPFLLGSGLAAEPRCHQLAAATEQRPSIAAEVSLELAPAWKDRHSKPSGAIVRPFAPDSLHLHMDLSLLLLLQRFGKVQMRPQQVRFGFSGNKTNPSHGHATCTVLALLRQHRDGLGLLRNVGLGAIWDRMSLVHPCSRLSHLGHSTFSRSTTESQSREASLLIIFMCPPRQAGHANKMQC